MRTISKTTPIILILVFSIVIQTAYIPKSPLIRPTDQATIAEGETWLGGWSYRQKLNITPSTGAGNNYTVPVALSYNGQPVEEFTYTSQTGSAVQASQGVATDGTDFWTTSGGESAPYYNFQLFRYNSSWDLQDNTNCSDDAPESSMSQVNGVFYFNDSVYVGASNSNNATYRSWILRYDADTLVFQEAIEMKSDAVTWIGGHTEGAAYYNNSWWVCWTNRMYVTQYDSNWNYVDEFALSYSVGGDPSGKYQGIVWIGNYVYFNIHDSGDPEKIDVYSFNGNTFYQVARLDPPHAYANQGFCLDPTDNSTVYFAIRSGADHEKVCWATATLDDKGDFDVNGNSRGDFADIRFTDGDGSSLLSYWEQYRTGAHARFWINVNDSLSSSNQTIYCYWGNSAAASMSNGTATFPFFDDFDRADSDSVGGSWTDEAGSGDNDIVNNTLSVNQDQHYYSHVEDTAPSLSNFCVEFMIMNDNDTGGTWHPSGFVYWSSYVWFSVGPRMDTSEHHGYDNDGGTTTNHNDGASSYDTWYYYKVMVNSSDVDIDKGTLWDNYSDCWSMSRGANFAGAPSLIILGKGFSNSGGGGYPNADLDNDAASSGDTNLFSYFDNVFVRNYVYPEPQVYVAGARESAQWTEINNSEFLFSIGFDPVLLWGYDVLLVLAGLIMLPISTLYIVKGGYREMSTNKLLIFLLVFMVGLGLFVGGIMP